MNKTFPIPLSLTKKTIDSVKEFQKSSQQLDLRQMAWAGERQSAGYSFAPLALMIGAHSLIWLATSAAYSACVIL